MAACSAPGSPGGTTRRGWSRRIQAVLVVRVAATARLTGDADAQIRLLNASHPTGEPATGQVVEVVE